MIDLLSATLSTAPNVVMVILDWWRKEDPSGTTTINVCPKCLEKLRKTLDDPATLDVAPISTLTKEELQGEPDLLPLRCDICEKLIDAQDVEEAPEGPDPRDQAREQTREMVEGLLESTKLRMESERLLPSAALATGPDVMMYIFDFRKYGSDPFPICPECLSKYENELGTPKDLGNFPIIVTTKQQAKKYPEIFPIRCYLCGKMVDLEKEN